MRLSKPLGLIFSSTSLSYIQQRIFNVLVWFAFNESRSSPFEGEHFIKIPLIKNQIHTNTSDTNDFYVRNAILDIIKNTYYYNILGIDKESIPAIDKSLFSSISIEHNIVKYTIDEDFMAYFTQDSKHIELSSKVIISLKSKYSLKLYEIAKAVMHCDVSLFSLDIFKKMMGVEKTYQDISGFKKRVLDISQCEVYQYSNILTGYFIDKKQNTISLYPQTQDEIENIINHMDNVFLDAKLLYKGMRYIYLNTHIGKQSPMFCLTLASLSQNEEFVISKSSIQEITFFIQKHIIIF